MKFTAIARRLALASMVFLATLAQAGEAEVREAMTGLLPQLTPDVIALSPASGLYEVVYGAHVFYVTGDGRYVLEGDLVDVKNRVNLTEEVRSAGRLKVIDAIGEDRMIVFSPEKPRHTITVFTDIDCGYCRKLHQEIAEYNKRGIRVRYLMYPRAGVDSNSYKKAVSVWCADDRQKALTDAKAGRAVAPKTCDNPVKDHMAAGSSVGVSGTPTIILESGMRMPGYVPAADLSRVLEQEQAG